MGLDIGKLLRNVLTAGSTYFRDQRDARHEQASARDLIGQNTDMMQGLYDRDYGDTALRDLAADPLDVLAQRQSMAGMRGLGDRYQQLSRTGYTDLDRQAMDQQFRQSRGEEQSQRDAVLAAAARRGDASGGNAVLGSLMAQQGGANRASDQSTDVALEGRRRAMDALSQYGQVQGALGAQAGTMRSQGVNEQIARGGAIDAFNQFGIQQQSMDAQALANARLGQSQSMQQHAAQTASTPNVDAGVNALANYYTAGAAGNVAGSGNTGAGPPQSGYGGYQTGGGGGNKSAAGGAPQPQAYNPMGGRAQPMTGRRTATAQTQRPRRFGV